MRPPVHMPLPAMMIAPECIVLICMDWLAVRVNVRFGSNDSIGLLPHNSRASASNNLA